MNSLLGTVQILCGTQFLKQTDEHVDIPELQVWMGKENKVMIVGVGVIIHTRATTKRDCNKYCFFPCIKSH